MSENVFSKTMTHFILASGQLESEKCANFASDYKKSYPNIRSSGDMLGTVVAPLVVDEAWFWAIVCETSFDVSDYSSGALISEGESSNE